MLNCPSVETDHFYFYSAVVIDFEKLKRKIQKSLAKEKPKIKIIGIELLLENTAKLVIRFYEDCFVVKVIFDYQVLISGGTFTHSVFEKSPKIEHTVFINNKLFFKQTITMKYFTKILEKL